MDKGGPKPIYIDKKELYELKDNVLRGYNGSDTTEPVTDANKMYTFHYGINLQLCQHLLHHPHQ